MSVRIKSDDTKVDNVCTGSNLEYKSIDLKYGDYVIKQSSISEGFIGIIIQIIWILILIILGRLITKNALKKAVIQGG